MTNSDLKNKKKSTDRSKSDSNSLSYGYEAAPPQMTKTHYSFEEAFNFIRSKFPDFTRGNFLNHGFRGVVSFFIKVHPQLEVRPNFTGATNSQLPAIHPEFLILSPLAVEEVERNGIAYLGDFPKGYFYDETYSLVEARPNYSHLDSSNSSWQTFCNHKKFKVKVSCLNLLISHQNIINLPKRILEILAKDTENIEEISQAMDSGIFRKPYYSLLDLASEIPNCKPMDLLRRAIRRNLTLITPIPSDIIVRSCDLQDYKRGIEYILQPQLLALNSLECTDIYNREKILLYKFKSGYIFDELGNLKLITPTNERYWVSGENISWSIYKAGTGPYGLELRCDDLYAIQSDVLELIDQDESQDFKISKTTLEFLAVNDFISVLRAVELAKLKHPECTPDHLLHFGYENKFEIITPTPNGISLHKYNISPQNKITDNTFVKSSLFLVLYIGTCITLTKGITEADEFLTYYFISSNQLKQATLPEPVSNGIATYYRDYLHKIHLDFDRLFIRKSDLLRVVNSESEFWISIDRKLRHQSANESNGEVNIKSHNKGHISGNKDAELCSDLKTTNINQDPSQTQKVLIERTAIDQSTVHKLDHEKIRSPIESSSDIGKILCRQDVIKLLGISKSGLYARMDSESKYYDFLFPQPIEKGQGKKHWLDTEIQAYMKNRINSRSGVDHTNVNSVRDEI